jgi:hypothetical protein
MSNVLTTRFWITLGGCYLATAVVVCAQTRKAGLWETTSTQTWQQSPMPGGAAPPGSGAPNTTKFCLTQQMIDRYNAIVPQIRGCQLTNVVRKANGMTADMTCTGTMNGKGNLESFASDSEHAKGKIHFIGSMKMGPNTAAVEWTAESSSVFKGADCGDVKPAPMPDSK